MLIVTILSLLMAVTMAGLALRLLREESRRSEARVAVLTAALDETPAQPGSIPAPRAPAPREPTFEKPAVQAAPLVRPAAPAPPVRAPQVVAIDPAEAETFFASAAPVAPPEPVLSLHDAATADDRPMFGDRPATPPSRDDRRWLAVAAVAIVAVLGLAGLRALWPTEPAPASAAPTTVVAGADGIPVELVSLGHERTGAGLVIRGLVRNPAAASARAGTSASVFLFDGEGGFLGSGRGQLDTPKLGAGDEAAFEVRLPDNPAVRRYRVTFRSPDGDVVPHLDRRGSGLAAANSGVRSRH